MHNFDPAWLASLLAIVFASGLRAEESLIDDAAPLTLPASGAHILRILTPRVLELTLISTKPPDPAPLPMWNFVSTNGILKLPPATEFKVVSAEKSISVEKVGFKRRALYAPLSERDLRVANQIYLTLKTDLAEKAEVEVKNPSGAIWPARIHFKAAMGPLRWSPAVHVNQLGYSPAAPKQAMAGYYLGSLGELPFSDQSTNPPGFSIVEADGGTSVFSGRLRPRRDSGFTFPCYERVWEADFSELRKPGVYRLVVDKLGASYPFWIGEGVTAALARTYALGLYHQRCGTNNVLPFTRFTHDVCHSAPATIPLPEKEFATAWTIIASKTVDATNDPRHTAAPMKDKSTCLYPFVRRGQVDVSGGHHDAGDYSKYTINSALLVHHLVLAADAFAGVSSLDNLGLPESGDGKSDVLQEAKWEADFLAKMQDDDGGFYFLVYPREREYESEVLPDKGDRQIVWPKTTAATAASVAALAQCASSPEFKKQFPKAAADYLKKAQKGWAFLEHAIAKYGRDGAYQKITHYGNEFGHEDELAWATCEMFIATGDQALHSRLRRMFTPGDPHLNKWGWWRLYEGYGCAVRSYALAVKSGKLAKNETDFGFLTKCENELISAAEDLCKRAENCAYGTSFPTETKHVRSAGWYFSGDNTFDLAAAYQLDYPIKNDPRPRILNAIFSNFSYQLGCNPVNVCFLTGLGSRRQREIVHQYAQNDRRILPPAGIPIGDVQSGFGWLDAYKQELGRMSFPLDGDMEAPYPMYDRWGDSFNLSTEFVALNQARGLAATAFLLAQTSLKTQAWKPEIATIISRTSSGNTNQIFELTLKSSDAVKDLIVWEASGEQPSAGTRFTPVQNSAQISWIEAEAVAADGRLIFAATNKVSPLSTATRSRR